MIPPALNGRDDELAAGHRTHTLADSRRSVCGKETAGRERDEMEAKHIRVMASAREAAPAALPHAPY
jgi:hypothetical protein